MTDLQIMREIGRLNTHLAYAIRKLDDTFTDEGYFYWSSIVDDLRKEILALEKEVDKK
ncbi:hypothetical protein D3C81_2284720 [compost metagenome]